MRWFFACPLLLTLAVSVFAQDREPEEEPVLPEKLEKVALTLDVGGHTATVTKVFFTPDSKQVVTVSMDHTIRIWDVGSGESVRVLYPPGFGGFSAAALSPDGKSLAIGSRYPVDGKILHVVYLVSLADGRIERVLKAHSRAIEAIAFSADGKRLASTSAGNKRDGKENEGTVRVWDLTTGELEKAYPFWGNPSSEFKMIRRGLAFSPDGRRLARVRLSGGPGDILDLPTGKIVARIKGQAVAWSPDGKTLATALAPQKTSGILLCNPDGRERLHLLDDITTDGYSVVFSNSSKALLATWGHGDHIETGIFDVATGKLLVKLAKVQGGQHGALSPDGELAATTTNHFTGIRGVTIWKTRDGEVVKKLWPPPAMVSAVGYTSWRADGKAVMWHKPGKNCTFHLEKLVLGPRLAAEDRRVAVRKSGDLSVEKTSLLKDGRVIANLKGHLQTLVGMDRAASAHHGIIYLYDAATGKEVRRLQGHQDEVNNLIPSPDGRFLFSTSRDQTVKIWNIERERPLLSLFARGNDWIAWTEEGYYAATPGGERLMGWKIDNGIDRAASFYPAEQFRKVLYRPDIIERVFARGSVEAAVKDANAARKANHQLVPRGEANPEKLLPPGTTLTVDASQPPQITLKVSARQSCPEQPIKSLRLLVDGRPLPGRQAVVTFAEGKEQAQHEETWSVELPPGKHRLSVLARSKDDTPSISNVINVSSPLPESQRPVVHHVAVGISTYQSPSLNLKFAEDDARQLADAVARHCAGPGNRYREVRTQRLLSRSATRSAVLDAIDAARKEARPNDLFLLSFAGHGVREEGEFFLLTTEADTSSGERLKQTAVSGAALREKLADFPCQVLLLLDACHSGAFAGGALAGYRPASDDAARALADVDVRVAVMCAALGHEEALEVKGNGLFTRSVLRALQHDPDCFYDRQTGELNIYHLQAFVSQEVARESDNKQTPYLKMPLASPPFVVTLFPR